MGTIMMTKPFVFITCNSKCTFDKAQIYNFSLILIVEGDIDTNLIECHEGSLDFR